MKYLYEGSEGAGNPHQLPLSGNTGDHRHAPMTYSGNPFGYGHPSQNLMLLTLHLSSTLIDLRRSIPAYMPPCGMYALLRTIRNALRHPVISDGALPVHDNRRIRCHRYALASASHHLTLLVSQTHSAILCGLLPVLVPTIISDL